MPFTVTRPGGIRGENFMAYLRVVGRQLNKQGNAFDQVPRVSDKETDTGWVYAWETEEEATAAVKALKKETGDSHWHVKRVNGHTSLGPLRPLDIEVSRQEDGWIFGLGPLMKAAVQMRFPDSCRYRIVKVGFETDTTSFITTSELKDLGKQVLVILTGLSLEQLRIFRTFRVIDPYDGTEFLPPTSL